MNSPATPPVSGPLQAATDDTHFDALVRKWIVGFHGDIKPHRESDIDARVRIYAHQEALYAEKIRFLLGRLPSLPTTALDIGSSAGGISVALAQAGVSVQGIEPSVAGVDVSRVRAQRLQISNASFQEGVGEKLPFADNSFDLAVSIAVLEHVQDVKRVVAETFRVLKPGGYAYFEVPNNIYPFEGHYKMFWLPMMPKKLAKMYVMLRGAYPTFLDHLHYMNRFIVMRRFREAGFVKERDLYGDFLYGKATGASWASSTRRARRYAKFGFLIKLFFDVLPSSLIINRAIFLIAQKPEEKAPSHG